jgi:hypothetical protein
MVNDIKTLHVDILAAVPKLPSLLENHPLHIYLEVVRQFEEYLDINLSTTGYDTKTDNFYFGRLIDVIIAKAWEIRNMCLERELKDVPVLSNDEWEAFIADAKNYIQHLSLQEAKFQIERQKPKPPMQSLLSMRVAPPSLLSFDAGIAPAITGPNLVTAMTGNIPLEQQQLLERGQKRKLEPPSLMTQFPAMGLTPSGFVPRNGTDLTADPEEDLLKLKLKKIKLECRSLELDIMEKEQRLRCPRSNIQPDVLNVPLHSSLKDLLLIEEKQKLKLETRSIQLDVFEKERKMGMAPQNPRMYF